MNKFLIPSAPPSRISVCILKWLKQNNLRDPILSRFELSLLAQLNLIIVVFIIPFGIEIMKFILYI